MKSAMADGIESLLDFGGIVDATPEEELKAPRWKRPKEFERLGAFFQPSNTINTYSPLHAEFLLDKVLPLVASTFPRLPRNLTALYVFFFDEDNWNDDIIPEQLRTFIQKARATSGASKFSGISVVKNAYPDGFPIYDSEEDAAKEPGPYHIKSDKTSVFKAGKKIDAKEFFFDGSRTNFKRSELYPLQEPVPLGEEVTPRSILRDTKPNPGEVRVKLLYRGYSAISLLLRFAILENKSWWKHQPETEKEYAQAYKWVIDTMEKSLTAVRVKRLRYSFIYGSKNGFFSGSATLPYSRKVVPQSLYTLDLRYKSGPAHRVYASACPDNFSVAEDSNVAQFVKFDDEHGETDNFPNKSGICVASIHNTLLDRGLTAKDAKNPAWKNWIGTWQQAQRRLEKYKRDADKLYNRENSMGTFDWVDYLKQWVMLKLDMLIKYYAGLSDNDGDAALRKAEKDIESGTFEQNTGLWETARAVAAKVVTLMKNVGQLGLVAVWKIVEWAIKSPGFQLVLEQLFNSVKIRLCEKFSSRTLRTSGENLQELDIKSGKWIDLSPTEREKIVREDLSRRKAAQLEGLALVNEAFEFLPACISDRYKVFAEGATVLSTIDYVAALVPGGPQILMTMGGAAAMADLIRQSFLNASFDAAKEFKALGETSGNILRVYQMFASNFNCSSAQLITLDGRGIGADPAVDWGKDYNVAYEIMMENLPFYTIELMATCPNRQTMMDEVGWAVHVSNYLHKTFVENNRGTTALYDEKKLSRAAKALTLPKTREQLTLVLSTEGYTKNARRILVNNSGIMANVYRMAQKVQAGAASALVKENLRRAAAGIAGGLVWGSEFIAGKERVDMLFEASGYSKAEAGAAAAAVAYKGVDVAMESGGDLVAGATYSLHTVLAQSSLREQTFRLEVAKYMKLFRSEAEMKPDTDLLRTLNQRLLELRAFDFTLSAEAAANFDVRETLKFFGELDQVSYFNQDLPGFVSKYTDRTSSV